MYSAPCWARCLPTCCRSGSHYAPNLSATKKWSWFTLVSVVTRLHGRLLFHFTETDCEVAGHQPEDICQVSTRVEARSLLNQTEAPSVLIILGLILTV